MKRSLLAALVMLSIVAPAPQGTAASDLAAVACNTVPREALLRTWRGIMTSRSGDIQLITREPDFVSGGSSHSTPFDYTQEVPFLIYGPGFVRPGRYDQRVTLADLAPTTGALLDFPFQAPDGQELTQALLPRDQRPLPRLVVTLIWDSAGTNVLDAWPRAWPYLRSLIPQGAWFPRAEAGASPSNTPTGHATMGTGAFPNRHGFVDEFIRLADTIEKPNANGPGFLIAPTLADLYDPAMGNEPLVGALASLSPHIMMMGHGAFWGNGDRDIAITRERGDAETGGDDSAVRWNLTRAMSPYYRLPRYANDLPGIGVYAEDLDRADGALDGRWRDHDLTQLRGGWDTPARTPFQTRLMLEVIEREGFGRDRVPDLLFLNYKAIDTVGHAFAVEGAEMNDAVRIQDRHLKILVSYLNAHIGRERWVMFLTSDHGTQHDPELSGAFRVSLKELERRLIERFDDADDRPLVQRVRVTEVWLDRAELAENGFTLAQVSEYLLGLTKAETNGFDLPLSTAESQEPAFAAVLPSDMLMSLPCLDEAREQS